MSEKKNKRFKLFDIAKDGKGVAKGNEVERGTLKHFFLSFKDNFGKLVSVNILMVLGNFPLIFLIATLSGFTKADAFLPTQDLFQSIAGIYANNAPSVSGMVIYALEGLQNPVLVPTVFTYICYGISALTLFTFGIVNVGTAYILRNMAKGEPIFTWTDFWYAVKKNWKQAFPFGIIDLAINAILVYNIYTLILGESGFFQNMLMWANIIIFVIYFFMRYYIYVQMVTFKLTVFKIIKNSLILALLGIKRNLMGLLGIIVFVLLEILFIFGAGGVLLPLGVAAPLCLIFSAAAYMKVHAAYFKIKEIMIDPYLAEHPEENVSDVGDEDEVIMRDDVTERNRLEEIKRKNGIQE